MAGGMNKRGGFGIPMTQGVALRDAVDPCPSRHCSVLDPADHSRVQRPGLVVEWTTPMMTSGYLLRAATAGGWSTPEEWLPAKSLVARPTEN